jgi:NPCBM/NEW2 domain
MPIFRALLTFFVGASLSLGAELHTLTGKTISGDLVKASEKEVVLSTSSGRVATPVSEILQIDFQREASLPAGAKYTDVELIDGSLLHCSRFVLKGKQAELKLAGADLPLTIPIGTISYVLNDAQEQATRQQWQEKFVGKKGNQDVLVVKREGVLNGVEGTLGDANDKGEITFEYGAGNSRRKRDVDPARVQGMIFVRALANPLPPVLCKVYDTGLNTLVAAKLERTPEGLSVTTVAGPAIRYPLPMVARLDYSNDKVVFLSDLKPAELIEKEKLRQLWRNNVRFDKNPENSLLQIKDKMYSKGLSIHASAEIVYALDGKYNKFEAVLGVDTSMEKANGHPVVKIEADGKELFSGTITKDDAVDLKCDVRGARQLRIVVSSRGLNDFGDQVDLANAKLSK